MVPGAAAGPWSSAAAGLGSVPRGVRALPSPPLPPDLRPKAWRSSPRTPAHRSSRARFVEPGVGGPAGPRTARLYGPSHRSAHPDLRGPERQGDRSEVRRHEAGEELRRVREQARPGPPAVRPFTEAPRSVLSLFRSILPPAPAGAAPPLRAARASPAPRWDFRTPYDVFL